MIKTYRKLYDILEPRERRNAILLLLMTLVLGLLEVIGVASVMPFIAVVANPSVIKTNPYLNALYSKLGFNDAHQFLIFLGGCAFILVVSSLSFKAFTQWSISRFTYMRNFSIGRRLLKGYLNQHYTWFLNRHSSDLGKTVLSEVGQVISGSLMPAMELMAHFIVMLFLLGLVILVEPTVAICSLLLLGGTYAALYAFLRRYLARIGVERVLANKARFKIAQEALAGIKEIKVLGLESAYLTTFSKPAARFAQMQASNQIISTIPQFILQGIAFGGIIAIIVVMLGQKQGQVEAVLPLIALYAFAGMRMLPALQQVYSSLAKLRFGQAALKILHSDIREVGAHGINDFPKQKEISPCKAMHLKKELRLDSISYTYPNASEPALHKISLSIASGDIVAFVGATGAGKTTAVDLILGLLQPQEGGLFVDGILISDENMRPWQRSIGYVPQHIFLIDDTIAANIAFGCRYREIDMEAVEKAARIANLNDFVVQQLSNGYFTKIGERGVRLSGGQRQRIGIARALYHDPDILIFDEATSALDNLTEKAVMRALYNVGKSKTVIIVAHRLSTVENCDQLFFFERGNIRSAGTYQELLKVDPSFREMVLSAQNR